MRSLSLRTLKNAALLPLGLALGLSACGPEAQSGSAASQCFTEPSDGRSKVCVSSPWDVAPESLVVIEGDTSDVVIRDVVIRDRGLEPDGKPWDVAPALVIRDAPPQDPQDPQEDAPWDVAPEGGEVMPALVIRDSAVSSVVIRDLAPSFECLQSPEGVTLCSRR
jgi:hypothetical protein